MRRGPESSGSDEAARRRVRDLVRRGWGRWIGIISARANAVIQLTFIASFPLAALALFAIDVMVIYGLASWDYREN